MTNEFDWLPAVKTRYQVAAEVMGKSWPNVAQLDTRIVSALKDIPMLLKELAALRATITALTQEKEKLGKYYDCWKSRADVVNDYGDKTPTEDELIYAGYTYEDYSGSALIVWKRDGKLYENNDGHCSCYGLEGWAPEETTAEALKMRKGWPGLEESLTAAGI